MNNDLNRNNYDIYYDKCCYDGDGIELNDNHVHEMLISEDIVFYDDHNVNAKTQGASLPCKNQLHECVHCFVNQNMVTVYGKDGIHSYILYADLMGEHSNITNGYNSHDCNGKVLMQILNKKVYYEGNWADVVHIMGVMIR